MDWLDEALEAAGWRQAAHETGETWRLEYLASAGRGDEVAVELYGAPAAWRARIRRADGPDLMRAQGIVRA
jgi:hypothetical protein